ncbi:MAG: flippase-like domain-containing protein [Schleiferiaceae bacterium]|nr:flippase-like domain-containing protein [Schleiferiaceae bacterium]
MNPKLKTTLKSLFFLFLGVALLYFAFGEVDIALLWKDLQKANYTLIFLTVVLGYLAVVSRGIRWTYLLRTMGYEVPKWHAAHAVGVGYLVNLAVPRAGEVARCTSLYKVTKVPVDKLLGTVIVERVVDMVMLLIMLALAFVFQFDNLMQFINFAGASNNGEPSDYGWLLWVFVSFLGILGIVYFAFRNAIINHPKFMMVRNFILGLKEGFATIFKMKEKGFFILHTLFIWVMYYLIVYIPMYALTATAHLGAGEGLLLMSSASLGIVIPVPVGGAGVYHYLVSSALQILQVSKENGLVYATLVHASQTLMLMAAGFVGLIALFVLNKRQLKVVSENV